MQNPNVLMKAARLPEGLFFVEHFIFSWQFKSLKTLLADSLFDPMKIGNRLIVIPCLVVLLSDPLEKNCCPVLLNSYTAMLIEDVIVMPCVIQFIVNRYRAPHARCDEYIPLAIVVLALFHILSLN